MLLSYNEDGDAVLVNKEVEEGIKKEGLKLGEKGRGIWVQVLREEERNNK